MQGRSTIPITFVRFPFQVHPSHTHVSFIHVVRISEESVPLERLCVCVSRSKEGQV